LAASGGGGGAQVTHDIEHTLAGRLAAHYMASQVSWRPSVCALAWRTFISGRLMRNSRRLASDIGRRHTQTQASTQRNERMSERTSERKNERTKAELLANVRLASKSFLPKNFITFRGPA